MLPVFSFHTSWNGPQLKRSPTINSIMADIDRRIITQMALCLVLLTAPRPADGASNALRAACTADVSQGEPQFLAGALARFVPREWLVLSSWGPGDESRDPLGPAALSDVASDTLLAMKSLEAPERDLQSSAVYLHTSQRAGQPVGRHARVDGYLLQIEFQSLLSLREGLDEIIKSLEKRQLWNPYAVFFVHIKPTSSFTDESMRDAVKIVFTLLWDNKAAISAASFCTGKKAKLNSQGQNMKYQPLICEIYSWSLFSRNGCEDSVNAITLVSNWNVNGDKKFIQKTSFPMVPPKKLDGCEMVVVTSQMMPYIILPGNRYFHSYGEGVEMRLLRILEKALGFKASLLIPPTPDIPRGDRLPNGTWDGTLGYLSQHRLGIGIHTYVIRPERTEDFASTAPPHLSLEFTWMVPRAGYLPRSTSLFRIFSLVVWLLVILSLPIASAFTFIMARGRVPISVSSLYAWATLLGVSYDAPYRLREFFLFWLYYCLVVNAAYQSGLISVLTHPGFEHQIQNEIELVDSSLDIEYHRSMEIVVKNSDDTYIRQKILARRRIVEESPDLLRRVAIGRNLALLTPRLALDFQGLQYVDDTGQPLIYTFKNNVVRSPIVLYLTKGHPLIARVNSAIMGAMVSGLMTQILEDVRITSLILYTPMATKQGSSGPQPLGLKNMQGAFYILVCGIVVSLLTVIFEVVYFRCLFRCSKSRYLKRRCY